MLKRKIETYLADWKQSEGRKPLVIKGIRQCGKTYIVQKFARENYDSVVYMNFILEPDKKSAFTGNIDVATIILNLSALIKGSRFIERKTCIILDEIQECKEASTALKSLHIEGRLDVAVRRVEHARARPGLGVEFLQLKGKIFVIHKSLSV